MKRQRGYITIPTAAKLIGCGRSTLHAWIAQGHFSAPTHPVPGCCALLGYTQEELDRHRVDYRLVGRSERKHPK